MDRATDFVDPETGAVVDLAAWVRQHGDRFEIVSALRARRPEVLTGKVAEGTKHHLRCPNEAAHTQAGADAATFAVDASKARNRGFAVHCRHAHCDGRDRLLFLGQMLEQRWLGTADLTDPAFLAPDRAGGAEPEDPELTEHGVALAFAARHGDRLRYCHNAGAWHVWTGTRWERNGTRLAFTWARHLTADLNRNRDFKTRAATGRAGFAAAVERFAQADEALAVTAAVWDRDPFLLGTPGGTVDLRTGALRAAARADLITRLTAVAPAPVGCPMWTAFLGQATGQDSELVGFLHRWCGYCLTGDTREHALLFGYGTGGNGKSVFLNTVARLLGDYHRTAAMDVLTDLQGSSQHKTFIAMLHGARLVTTAETEEGRAWAETKLKELTGGTEVTANFMRRDPFSFVPTFKITITGNHKPVLRNPDEAMRRRLNIVPFVHRPERPDRELEAKLRAEWPGILRWMVDGCLAWQRDGLARPKVVVDATAEYFAAQDHFGRWLAECCVLDPALSTKPAALLGSFKRWCEANGEPLSDNRRLRGTIERTQGLRYATNNGTQWVRGVGLKPGHPSPGGGGVDGGGA